MPDVTGLVRRVLEAKLENRHGRILLVEAQERDRAGMAREQGEVEGRVLLHPLDSERPRSPGRHGARAGARCGRHALTLFQHMLCYSGPVQPESPA
jgi:hypothetical protein